MFFLARTAGKKRRGTLGRSDSKRGGGVIGVVATFVKFWCGEGFGFSGVQSSRTIPQSSRKAGFRIFRSEKGSSRFVKADEERKSPFTTSLHKVTDECS